MADTPNGETVTPGDSQTTVTTTSAPVTDNASAAEVERLRKEQEQKDIRIRQLENEAKARTQADEEARNKKLEQDQEYKTLLEQERAKRKALEDEADEREAKTELSKAKAEAIKDFSEDVQKQAEDLGIDLTNADEAAVEAYKAKLTKLNDSFATNGKVTPNNGQQRNPKYDQHEVLQAHAKGDVGAFDQALAQIPWIAENTPKQ